MHGHMQHLKFILLPAS